MSRFVGVPSVPLGTLDDWQARLLNALKENVELLTDQRNEADKSSVALTKAAVTAAPVTTVYMKAVSARGLGLNVSGAQVPSLADYTALVQDFQRLSADVALLRSVVNTLIVQLRS